MMDARRQPERLAASTSHVPRGQGERVLYVDDDDDVRRITTALITHLGYRVRAFSRPAEAQEAFMATPYDFDVVVTDFIMPGMRGDEFLRQLRSIRADLPALLVSGVANAIDGGILDGLQPVRLLLKPISLSDLDAALRGALDNPGA